MDFSGVFNFYNTVKYIKIYYITLGRVKKKKKMPLKRLLPRAFSDFLLI